MADRDDGDKGADERVPLIVDLWQKILWNLRNRKTAGINTSNRMHSTSTSVSVFPSNERGPAETSMVGLSDS